jgi:predicted flap endonuclease-1-like 5' DNA nuclease
MPELTAVHIGLIAGMLVVGAILGWVFRGDRCAKEKMAVNASWQEQIESQQSEHNRLAEQNKSLMEQISQYQASHKDSANRARELSDSLRESFARRDEMQKQLREIRGNLELALAQRDKLKSTVEANAKRGSASAATLKDKDDKIFRLSRELTSWQSRVPPLVEKYQEHDRRVRDLEAELGRAESRIAELEADRKSEHTRIEPVDNDALPGGLDASNEQYAATSAHEVSALHDQIRQNLDAEIADSNVDDDANYIDFDAAAELVTVNDCVDEEQDEAVAPVRFGNQARDDLKEIKGVGPAIEKTLNDLGIYHFNQIAEMSEYDIDRVARQLKGFRSRIYRENWIGQARDLQYRKLNS